MTANTTEKSRKIFMYHDLHPEDGAMLQALYSRSPASVETHLEKVRNADTGKFMSKFYVGYGHASIGDCGVTNIFIENVSMLACKAIQDNPLYSGQEASTRYLDFSVQPMKDPYKHPTTTAILNRWMYLYNTYLPMVIEALKKQYPFEESKYKSEKIWNNAIEARGFDTMRSFLPVGTTTLFSWTTNLRQLRDRLMVLKNHPLEEVREMAHDLFNQSVKQYGNSFNGSEMDENTERYGERDTYYKKFAERDNYQTWEDIERQQHITAEEITDLKNGEMVVRKKTVDVDGLNEIEGGVLTSRPKWASLPKRLASYGSYNLTFLIDFGSYRDIQRHRNGVCQIPLIDNTFGFHGWYLDELKRLLPEKFSEIKEEISAQLTKIHTLSEEGIEVDTLKNQYLYPMGMSVACNVTYSVPQMVYVSELRSGKTVHPSLRPVAQNMAKVLEDNHTGIALYVDWDAASWDAKRGEQTIMEKTG
jgi:thymidylate synthase ThyX